MIKDLKSFLRLQYVSRNVSLDNEKFEVLKIAWLHFKYGEQIDDEGNLELMHHLILPS